MVASALTVTPPNPTPPTNMSFTGATPPNVPNYTKTQYANPFDMLTTGPNIGTPDQTVPGVGVNPNPPPYFDYTAGGVAIDGPGGTLPAFKANTTALAGGTGATSGGTEGTYPGTGTGPNGIGAVPASTSVAHEGAGTESVAQKATDAAGALQYNPNTFLPYSGSAGGVAGATGTWQMITVGTGPAQTAATLAAGPNASHASYISSSLVPTAGTASAGGTAGPGTTLLTLTGGTNFNRSSVVYVDGIPQNTNYVSPTSLTVTNAPKKQTAGAGNVPVIVRNGSGAGPSSASINWAFT